jgi:hypothetical protein
MNQQEMLHSDSQVPIKLSPHRVYLFPHEPGTRAIALLSSSSFCSCYSNGIIG